MLHQRPNDRAELGEGLNRRRAPAVLGVGLGADGDQEIDGRREPDTTVSPVEAERMSRGEIIVKPLPSRSQQLGVFAVTEIGTSPDVFVEWIRQISQMQRSKAVAASGRFSSPP